MSGRIERRQLLGALAAGVAASAAGCGNATESSGRDPSGTTFPTADAGGGDPWRLVREDREAGAGGFGTASNYATRVYEHAELRREMRDLTLGQFDEPLALFFATHVDLSGPTSMFVSPRIVADEAEESFRAELEANEIRDVREVEPTEPLPNPGVETVVREFRGSYRTPVMSQTVPLAEREERTLTFDPSHIEVAAFYAVWKRGNGTAFVAGGAYPTEDYEASDEESVTGERGTGIDLDISVRLPMRPEEIRRDIVRLVETVELEG